MNRLLPAVWLVIATWLFSACAPGATDPTGPDAGAPPPAPLFVVSTFPRADATAVQGDVLLTAVFSEAVDPASFDPAAFQVTENQVPVPGAVSINGSAAVFAPVRPFSLGAVVQATLSISIRSPAGNHLATPYRWSFEVGNALAVEQVTPAEGTQDVPPSAALAIRFDQPLSAGASWADHWKVTADGQVVEGTIEVMDETATFTPSAPLPEGATVVSTVKAGLQAQNGAELWSDTQWTFRVDLPLRVSAFSPQDGAISFYEFGTVKVVFNQEVDPSSVTDASVKVTHQGQGLPVSRALFARSGRSELLISMNGPGFPQDAAIEVTLTAEVKTPAGKPLAEPLAFGFKTRRRLTLVEKAPEGDFVARDDTIRATFSHPLDPTSVNEASFFVFNVQLGAAVPGTRTVNQNEVTFTPAAPFPPGNQIRVAFSNNLQDLVGTTLEADDATWLFRTVHPISVRNQAPPPDARCVLHDAVVRLTFDRRIQAATLSAETVQLRRGTNVVSGMLTVNDPGSGPTSVTFTPSAPLDSNTTYTVALSDDLLGEDGNRLEPNSGWSFSTALNRWSPANAVALTTSGDVDTNSMWSASAPDGTTTVVWVNQAREVWSRRSSSSGWEGAVRVASAPADSDAFGPCFLQVDRSGTATLACRSGVHSWVSRRSPSGAWQSPLALSNPQGTGALLSLATAFDGSALLVWKAGTQLMVRTLSSGTPSAPAYLAAGNTSTAGVLSSIRGPSDAVVGWTVPAGSGRIVYAARLTGTGWTAPESVYSTSNDNTGYTVGLFLVPSGSEWRYGIRSEARTTILEARFTSNWSPPSASRSYPSDSPTSAATSRNGGVFILNDGRADVLDSGTWRQTFLGANASSLALSDTSYALAATAFTYSEFVTVRQSCGPSHWTGEVRISVQAFNPTLSYRSARATVDDAGRGTVAWVKLVPGSTTLGDIWVNRAVP